MRLLDVPDRSITSRAIPPRGSGGSGACGDVEHRGWGLLAIAGPSGSGKSTLLNSSAVSTRHSGKIFIDGRDTSGHTPIDCDRGTHHRLHLPDVRPPAGLAAENVGTAAPVRLAAPNAASASGSSCRRWEAWHHWSSEPSGGQRQWLRSARFRRAAGVIADEPTANLTVVPVPGFWS